MRIVRKPDAVGEWGNHLPVVEQKVVKQGQVGSSPRALGSSVITIPIGGARSVDVSLLLPKPGLLVLPRQFG